MKKQKQMGNKITDLKFDDKNFNKGTQYGKKLMEQSLSKFGAGRSILIDKNNRIIAGNKTTENFGELGLEDVKIVETDGKTLIAVRRNDIDLDTPEGREFALADNQTARSNIDFDFDNLENELEEDTLEEWGIEIPEEEVLEAEEDNFNEAPPEEPITVLGDLIEIGEHRLLCGDSTDTKLIDKVLNNSKIELLLTDPPYGIDYGGMLKGKGDGKGGADKNGWKSYDAPDWDKSKPEKGVLQYLCEISDNQIIWGGNYFTDDLPPTMGWLIWDKGQRGFSLADGEMAWTSFNNALRIKEYARAKANREEKNHPTQKPQKIMQWCFEYADRHSKKEIKLIFDAYLGSGSTMVASHQLKRKCYGMELDPKYCDVIIKRMLKLDDTLTLKVNGVVTDHKKY